MKIGYLRQVEFVVSCMAFSGGMGKVGQYLASISESQAPVVARSNNGSKRSTKCRHVSGECHEDS